MPEKEMTAETAYQMVNAELVYHGHPIVLLTDAQKQSAFNGLREYAHTTGRPIEVCIADLVRFQIQGETLEGLRA